MQQRHDQPRLVLLLVLLSACPERTRPTPAAASDSGTRANPPLDIPPREPGPARPESAEEVARETEEAKRLLSGLRRNVSARQLTSMADIRGYRLYRQRRFKRAQVWFEAAVQLDPSYEFTLYNAARVASLLGDTERATTHLRHLKALGTPLARRALDFARSDPDMRPSNRP